MDNINKRRLLKRTQAWNSFFEKYESENDDCTENTIKDLVDLEVEKEKSRELSSTNKDKQETIKMKCLTPTADKRQLVPKIVSSYRSLPHSYSSKEESYKPRKMSSVTNKDKQETIKMKCLTPIADERQLVPKIVSSYRSLPHSYSSKEESYEPRMISSVVKIPVKSLEKPERRNIVWKTCYERKTVSYYEIVTSDSDD